ncbi:MAG TPA: hypothetical protein VGD10_09645 [Allosphingosinicella sp.]|uniref:hypothetical protein n=1 Tax=Allosphingosinicella sp. TaxID=2823234 RepID=UPI002EDBADDD
MDGTGEYRLRGADGHTHTAFVNDRSIAFNISEKLYRWRGYKPSFDELPWVEAGAPLPPRTARTRIKAR